MFSLEMGRDQVTDRLLAMAAGVDLAMMRSGRLHESDMPRLATAAGVLHDSPILIDDTPGITPLALRAKARREHRRHPLGLIIVDYVQLMGGEGDGPEQIVSACSQGLKDLARELSIPVIMLSQLSREVEKRKPPVPRPSDLRSSGSLEQDADKIVFLYRASMYSEKARKEKPNEAQAFVSKNRNGPQGRAVLYFDAPKATFRSSTRQLPDYPSDDDLPPGNWQDAEANA
jgi:replicative DNA helicase